MKTLLPIDDTVLGMFMLVRLVQFSNIPSLINRTDFGKLKLVRLEQSAKA